MFFFACIFFIAVLQAAAQPKPDPLASYRLGRDLESAGRTDEANVKYNEVVRICSDEIAAKTANMDTYWLLTASLQRQKKYSDVISRGQEALRNGNDYRIIETMGEAYFYLGNYASSLKSMQTYVNQAPNGDRTSTAYFFMGEIYRFQKKFHSADIAYTTAVQLSPEISLWWFRLGIARESAGSKQYAIEAYEKAIKLDPTYAQAKDALARIRQG